MSRILNICMNHECLMRIHENCPEIRRFKDVPSYII